MAEISDKIESATLDTSPDGATVYFWAWDSGTDQMIKVPLNLLPGTTTASVAAPLTNAGAVGYGNGSTYTADTDKLKFDSSNKFLGVGLGSDVADAGLTCATAEADDQTPDAINVKVSHGSTPSGGMAVINKVSGYIYARFWGGLNDTFIKVYKNLRIITNVTNALGTGGRTTLQADEDGNVVAGGVDAVGSATGGFLFIPVSATAPGTPAKSYTGKAAIYFDSSTTPYTLKYWNGSAWTAIN